MRFSTVAVWLHIMNTTRRSERFQRGDWNSKVQASYYSGALRGNAQILLSIAVAVAVAADAAGSQNGRFLIRIELKINENGQPGLQNGRFLIRI